MTRSARAVYFVGPRNVEVREESINPIPDSIRITSEVMALSHGSELRVYRGELPASSEGETIAALSSAAGYPVKYGYMNVGRDEGGLRYFAFFPHQDVFYCAQADLLAIPEEISAEDAVLLPSVETALNITHDAHPRYGEVVLIAGQGMIGLLTSELLLRSGARVIALETSAARRARSARLGCVPLDPAEVEPRSRISDLTDGRGPDICVNTTGSGEALQVLIDTAAEEAHIVEASWYGTARTSLSLGTAFHRKRLRIASSQVTRIRAELLQHWTKGRRFELVMELIRQLRPSKYVSHRFALADAPAAYRLLEETPDDVLQILLEP